jgi:hypothetical protein
MTEKKDETKEIEELKEPSTSLPPLLSNAVGLRGHPGILMLDFGFVAPSYSKPYGLEDTQVARICMSWDTAELLFDSLKEAISDYKGGFKETKAKTSKRG